MHVRASIAVFLCAGFMCAAPMLMVMSVAMAETDHKMDARIESITKDLRCLTCPNESIAESTSPMALDVKDYMRQRLQDNISAQQIIDELTARYGEELRYKPVLANHTWALWFAPLFVVMMGVIMVWRMFGRHKRTGKNT